MKKKARTALEQRTVREVIDNAAKVHPERVFLVAPETGRRYDYAALQTEALATARHLAGLGLKKGEPVSFMLGNGSAAVNLLLGSMYGGFVSVPLNTAAGPSQIAYAIAHSETRILFVSSEHRELLNQALKEIDVELRIVNTDLDAGPEWPEAETKIKKLLPVDAEDNALLMYTSGTTGNPKGVLLTHGNVLAGGANTAGAHELTDADRGLCVLPLCHINAQIVTVFGPLVSGGSVTMPHRFSVSLFWKWVIDFECTWFSVVPTIISYLAHDQNPPPRETLRNVRFGRSASAPLPPVLHETFEKKFGITIVETMGLTETAAQILSNPMPPKRGKYGSPGVAYGNVVKIVDTAGNDVAANTEGEIVVRGPNVMRGYLKNPEATRESLDPDGWLHTGDLGRKDEDGYVFVTGRLKELIIKGGENISPREIDDVLYSHPAVVEAGTVGIPDDHYGEDVVACVVINDEIACNEQELIEYCAARVGAFKAPRAIYFMSDLPKGPSGKVQRRKLVSLIRGDFPTTI